MKMLLSGCCSPQFLGQCQPSELLLSITLYGRYVPTDKKAHGFSKLEEFSVQLEVVLAANNGVPACFEDCL